MNTYLALKAAHIASAVLMVGNVTVTGFWATYMYRSSRALGTPFRPIARAILWTDLVFTLLGGAGLSITGTAMVLVGHMNFWQTGWLLRGVGALILSTLAWLVILLPVQWRLERAENADERRRLFVVWSVVGWLSTVLLFYSLWAMTTKQ